MLLTIFKKIQLFSFGFATSASALVLCAVMAGDLSGEEVQDSVAELSLQYLNDTPEGMTNKMADYLSLRFGEPEESPAKLSLEALRERQQG